jgi:hypothetical protein
MALGRRRRMLDTCHRVQHRCLDNSRIEDDPEEERSKMMIYSVFSLVVSRLPFIVTVLTMVFFAGSAGLQPASALASPTERADLVDGASYLEDDDNGNQDNDRKHNNENNDDNGNRENRKGENREADTSPQFASAGNGGVATATADGGVVLIGDINSGGNAGNAIGIGDTTWGSVTVYGGDVANSTGISVAADGGTGIADASGGNNNLAGVQD